VAALQCCTVCDMLVRRLSHWRVNHKLLQPIKGFDDIDGGLIGAGVRGHQLEGLPRVDVHSDPTSLLLTVNPLYPRPLIFRIGITPSQ
jgi:hypothetical protein